MMKKEDFLKNWNSKPKMEDMSLEELSKYIQMAMEVELNEIIPIPYVGGIDQEVTYDYPELTALCPVTGIQDLYRIVIKFIPNEKIPELKSLKFYFLDYVSLPISHEHLQAKIFKDFKKVIEPKDLHVFLDVAIRGGIKTMICYSELEKIKLPLSRLLKENTETDRIVRK
jgi:7-cyano-7-deazaguanine reductase